MVLLELLELLVLATLGFGVVEVVVVIGDVGDDAVVKSGEISRAVGNDGDDCSSFWLKGKAEVMVAAIIATIKNKPTIRVVIMFDLKLSAAMY